MNFRRKILVNPIFFSICIYLETLWCAPLEFHHGGPNSYSGSSSHQFQNLANRKNLFVKQIERKTAAKKLRRSRKQYLFKLKNTPSGLAHSSHLNLPLGVQNPPPGPGEVPDYFGITPNYANSPQPQFVSIEIQDPGLGQGAQIAATTIDYLHIDEVGLVTPIRKDGIQRVEILNGGSHYSVNTKIIARGGPGVQEAAILSPIIENGVIRKVEIKFPGRGYVTPLEKTGIRKFVDRLPLLNKPNNLQEQIPIAVPDTKTFKDSDYYEITAGEYLHFVHSDLGPVKFRGFKQINGNGPAQNFHFLGPTIVAQKDRPVRIKFVNQLPVGPAGRLNLPVDTTYMGADETQNRISIHLHGGNTPWISDGTAKQWVKPKGEVQPNKGISVNNIPDMWFGSDGKLVSECAGALSCAVPGASNDPGEGAQTFYFTNQQSARMLFYHDHAEGLTRLNVYSGLVAGYFIEDQMELSLIENLLIPGRESTIPIVLQDKTFLPDRESPLINFFGAFRSQLESQDPTWSWPTPSVQQNALWFPHVYMPNQNSGDISGANPMGRWDYGPWFWPPFTGRKNVGAKNPYYDPNCDNSMSYCEGPLIPGLPLHSPSGVPEAFNDTAVINGTAYPYVEVEPKKYRLRILSVGNDRMFNLSLVVAADKNSPTEAESNRGSKGQALLCNGDPSIDPQRCTEVKMVPFDQGQNIAEPFPPWWYSRLTGGTTLDGRPSGVFSPSTRGPALLQIGNDGGFLPEPTIIKNQPINFEYNRKNAVFGSVKEHALFLGPAERADLIVDFSQFAGSTLILYNDAGAPLPMFDPRYDYYTGSFDNTDTGGSFATIPGYGPNTRTLLQFRVAEKCNLPDCGLSLNRPPSRLRPVDDYDPQFYERLKTALIEGFKTGQPLMIVPQASYNKNYGTMIKDTPSHNFARVTDTQLSFPPYISERNLPVSPGPTITLTMHPKSIIEDFSLDYGRMNALLGTEVPNSNLANQTSILQGYMDPPTELVRVSLAEPGGPSATNDGTQIWKVTHNGVDTHAIHFHLFDVQLINRVGWDGAILAPDRNELGWKDTIKMHPLQETIIALRPRKMNLPFKIPNSHHTVMPVYNLSPVGGGASNVRAGVDVNFGSEYLWHCHLLGHEEHDMMRVMATAFPPETPRPLRVERGPTGQKITWMDLSMTANWFTIQRDVVPSFDSTDLREFHLKTEECRSQLGCLRYYDDPVNGEATPPDPSGPIQYYYRIKAHNTVGAGDVNHRLPIEVRSLTPEFIGYDHITASSPYVVFGPSY